MDEADRALEEIEREIERQAARRLPAGPAPTGVCLWCGLIVSGGRRWCDAECRDEWQHDQERRHAHPA